MLAEIDESCGEMVEELFNLYKGKIFSGRNIGQNYCRAPRPVPLT